MTYQLRWRHQYQRVADVLHQLEEQVEDELWPESGANRRHDRDHPEYVVGCGTCHIRRLVAAAPPMTDEQRSTVVRLLSGPIQKAAEENRRKASTSIREIRTRQEQAS